MRAREPDHQGAIERDGVRVGYDVYGAGEPTILLLTSWAIVHARQLADYRGWVEFFMSQVFTEPHSIKQQEDGLGWGLDTTAVEHPEFE